MKVLVTGATGFVGSALVGRLVDNRRFIVRAVTRCNGNDLPPIVDHVAVGDLTACTTWQSAFSGVDAVVHLAARVHMMSETAANPLSEFRKINVEGTLNLARQAATAGVKRFIFTSSIKVNGESTLLGHPYTADDTPAAVDPYGISKQEAEHGLRIFGSETGMEVVIIRSPLVYGPGVKANFLSMMHWLYKEVPLPLGAVRNKRSLVALDNLVDLIVTCIRHPAAANQTFLAGDGEDLSTTELLQRMGEALGKPARLLPVPARLLEGGAAVIGKRGVARRLCSSLQVDIGKTRELLDWTPPVSVDEALRKTARHFLESQSR